MLLKCPPQCNFDPPHFLLWWCTNIFSFVLLSVAIIGGGLTFGGGGVISTTLTAFFAKKTGFYPDYW